jgi:hypothetical protein
MRYLTLLAALCSVSELAIAQTSTCQSISKAADRLACYDKALRQPLRTNDQHRKGCQTNRAITSTGLQWKTRADAKLRNI